MLPRVAARLVSLDVFRGVVMFCLISGGLGLPELAKNLPENTFLQKLALHTEHAAWEGAVFWDFIQPAFMFIVGVSLAFSCERRADTQPYMTMFLHVCLRACLLVLLGIFLRSYGLPQTNFIFTDVLSQIGLGSVFVFLLWRQSFATQAIIAISVLITYWCFFYFFPVDAQFDYAQYQMADYQPLEGLRAHWNMHTNAAANFDRWFLNLLPRAAPYTHTAGGYQTLNFVPAAITMLLGLMAGEWLLADHSSHRQVVGLLLAGAVGIGVGYALHTSGLCPIVKRIWTPSWTLYSAGWASLALGICYFLFDVANLQPIAVPLIALGRNSILLYVAYSLLPSWLLQSVRTHLNRPLFAWLAAHEVLPLQVREEWKTSPPADIFALFGNYQPVAEHAFIAILFSILALWLHRRRFFLKI